MKMLTAKQVIQRFNLTPLNGEGGLYRQTYKSADIIDAGSIMPRFSKGQQKPMGTAIQYMITPSCFSRLHRLPTDEVYHFYLGSPVQLFLIPKDGQPQTIILGQDIMAGMEVQFTVPALCWQGSRLLSGGTWALVGTTMSPGYTDSDYEDADPKLLSAQYPLFASEIKNLTEPAQFEKI